MPIFLLMNWRWLIPTAAAALLAIALGVSRLEIAHLETTAAETALSIEKAKAEAFQHAQALQRDADQVAIDLAGQQSTTQEKIVTRTMTITKEIPIYVKDTSDCVTVGLIRVLDAAAIGVDPATLALAPGQFDETCAGVGARALAQSIVDNYGRAHQNAAELTDLQAYVKALKTRFDQERAAADTKE